MGVVVGSVVYIQLKKIIQYEESRPEEKGRVWERYGRSLEEERRSK
jgi:hypothetical protein